MGRRGTSCQRPRSRSTAATTSPRTSPASHLATPFGRRDDPVGPTASTKSSGRWGRTLPLEVQAAGDGPGPTTPTSDGSSANRPLVGGRLSSGMRSPRGSRTRWTGHLDRAGGAATTCPGRDRQDTSQSPPNPPPPPYIPHANPLLPQMATKPPRAFPSQPSCDPHRRCRPGGGLVRGISPRLRESLRRVFGTS